MNNNTEPDFNELSELAEKIFVQNSKELGNGYAAEGLAHFSFECASRFLRVKQERKLQAPKEIIEDLED